MARSVWTLTGRRLDRQDRINMRDAGVSEEKVNAFAEARAPYLGSPSHLKARTGSRTTARNSRGSSRTRATTSRNERNNAAHRRDRK